MSNDKLSKTDKNLNTVSDMMKKKQKQIMALVSGQLDPVKFATIAMTTIRTNDKLQQSTPASLITAILMAAQRGLSLDPNLGHAYLIPYWNSQLKSYEAQYQTGYKGKIHLAKRDGGVVIDTFVVHENDEFEVSRSESGDTLKHTPCGLKDDPGEAIGWVARARLPDDVYLFEVMRRSEIEKIRQTVKAMYKGKDTPAWSQWYDQQARGKAINRLAKYLPMVQSLQEDASHEDAIQGGNAQVIEITAEDGSLIPTVVPKQIEETTEESQQNPMKNLTKKLQAENKEKESSTGEFDPCDELILIAKKKWGDKQWSVELKNLCEAHKINSSKMSGDDAAMMLDVLNQGN